MIDGETVKNAKTGVTAPQWSMSKAPASENDDAITFALTNTRAIEIKVTKQWMKDGSNKTFDSAKNISFTLYQVLTPTDGGASLAPQVYTTYGENGVGTVSYTPGTGWNTVPIQNLPLTVTRTEETGNDAHEVTYSASYYVVETAETADAGYVLTTTYSNENDATNPAADASTKKVNTNGSTITIINTETPGVELPSTGGTGTTVYTLAGLTLLLGASLILYYRRRREQN